MKSKVKVIASLTFLFENNFLRVLKMKPWIPALLECCNSSLIINKIDDWNLINDTEKKKRIKSLLNLNDIDNLSVYFDKYSVELKNNTLNYYIKSVIKPKN